MTFNVCFWVLMLVWAIFGYVTRANTNPRVTIGGNALLVFVLFVLLGWKVFGAPLHS
jgi:hypothetical protein